MNIKASVHTHTHTPPSTKPRKKQQMWIRKKENEAILGMLDKLDLLKETPPAFDALIADRRYLAAVTRLDQAIGAMFRCASVFLFFFLNIVCMRAHMCVCHPRALIQHKHQPTQPRAGGGLGAGARPGRGAGAQGAVLGPGHGRHRAGLVPSPRYG